MRRPSGALLAVLAALSLATPSAHAFCRTTTCDVPDADKHPECVPEQRDDNHCSLLGHQLFWPTRCVSFGIQEDGSKKRGITWQTTDQIVRRAFGTWSGADCGDGKGPSLEIYDMDEVDGPIVCPNIEVNESAPNANVWLYRDDAWPYDNANNALALTTLSFDRGTGRILDADVEINSFGAELTTSDDDVAYDLQSILTHETGHFLGLGHEFVERSTMNTTTDRGSTAFRTLEADDVAGICAIYPPDRAAPECNGTPTPLHGFSRYCGDEQTGTVRSELSLEESGGCACSFDHSGSRAQDTARMLLTVAACVSVRRGLRRKKRGIHV